MSKDDPDAEAPIQYLDDELPGLDESYLRAAIDRPEGNTGGSHVTGKGPDWTKINDRAKGTLSVIGRVTAVIVVAIWPR